jgi:hypothetical protein
MVGEKTRWEPPRQYFSHLSLLQAFRRIVSMLAQRPIRGCFRWNLILLPAVLGVVQLAAAQNPPAAAPAPPPQSPTTQNSATSDASIAAAARDAKAQKAKAKKVFTDEDMEATAGPLPRLKMDGPENSDDVVAAIAKYKTDHTPEQTENAVHIWYDRYDDMLAAAIPDESRRHGTSPDELQQRIRALPAKPGLPTVQQPANGRAAGSPQ